MTRPETKGGLKMRTRILLVCGAMFLISFALTARASLQVRQLADRMDESFATNRELLEVENALQRIETDVEDYLNTRSTASLEAYYDDAQAYTERIASFHREASADEYEILEKNIARMSETYLLVADKAIAEKRGRDIDAYQVTYTTLTEQYRFLQAMLSTLNSRRFEANAVSNEYVMESAENAARSAMVILALTAIVNVFLIYMLRRMVDPMESEMREREIRMETQVKDAELKYLRAQINPHFLFNTLNAGTQLAMLEGSERTYQYLHKVADFYRYLVHQEGVHSTLQKELEIVDDFMYIINVRYGGEIAYEKETDEQLNDVPLPSMILQPIVENCVKHGLSEQAGEKKVTVRALKTEDNSLCIEIKDNGSGMEKETIAALLSADTEESASETGVGIRNVLRRLRMYYNKEDIMEIESAGTGTCVRLTLPPEPEED